MTLPIRSILWAPTNAAHFNHLHVEGDPRFTGTPPPNNPGMSDSVWTIYVALSERFGEPAYFQDGGGDWTHMGWYNRRKIAGSTSWSQHAWSNALDIGPYYGVAQQQRFYDFLTNEEDDMPTSKEIATEVWHDSTIPDPEKPGQRTHMSDAVKRSFAYSLQAAQDAALAVKLIREIAVAPGQGISEATIQRLREEVAEEIFERMAD